MTLRGKLAAFHARIHSHRHNGTHFHLSHLKPSHRRDASTSTTSNTPCPKPTSSPSPSPSHRSSSRQSPPPSSRGSKSRLSPVLTLMLPTGAGNVEARVYHPAEFPAEYGAASASCRKAAVVAHPYASLGGNWDDPVVLALVGVLVARGWVVATFNFGGAGNSKGKTSWTGAPEREEYATVAAFLIRYVECLDPNTFTYTPSDGSGSSTTSPVKATADEATNTQSGDTKRGKPAMKVLMAGYSYGSLIASRVPSAERVVRGCDRDVLAYATRTAYEWASTERRRSFAMHRGAGLTPWCRDEVHDEQEGTTDHKDTRTEEDKVNYNVQTKLETSWLLVSPLLPPVSFVLNLPNPMSWFQKKQPRIEADGHEDEEECDKREVLAVYGTDDMFTGVTRYRNWAKGRTERGEGKFAAVEVEGAGHFWMQEEAWMAQLREGVAGWIDERISY
ncbi:hypothetical protein TWF696_007379 [Orbilia brochopaga]|uniref:AB hydrolase-1 domain-containing protein n=1 Tax=Orbilia brochopaga TaxID=3140254 RepID=A0AAV9UT89_9PEZI